jgi:hypothetical protein
LSLTGFGSSLKMSLPAVFFVGLPGEVCHHTATFLDALQIQIVDSQAVVEQTRAGDLAIFFSEHFDRFRHAIACLKQRNVATLYLIDGVLEWRNAWENRPEEPACPFTMRPILCHKAACIGLSQARVLDSWGNREKLEIVGIPRFDRLRGLTKRQPSGGNFRVLVMTAKVPGFTSEQMKRTRQSLLDLKHWFEEENKQRQRFPDRNVEVIWRLTAGLAGEIEVENRLSEITGTELLDQLLQVDAVISTPSTAMLEAMLLDLPVASLDYHQCPSYLQNTWTITHRETISQIMRELADPPEAKMFFQRNQLKDQLALDPQNRSPESPTATDRLIQLVRSMQEIAAKQIESGEPLDFPARVLPLLTGDPIEFDHQRLFPYYSEFSENDIRVTQVELAQARREIEHLHRELRQVQTELNQAHAIFDQIQQHPVAGPIVRLRQKFLDWFSRNQDCVEAK